jgi:hypothetical protein
MMCVWTLCVGSGGRVTRQQREYLWTEYTLRVPRAAKCFPFMTRISVWQWRLVIQVARLVLPSCDVGLLGAPRPTVSYSVLWLQQNKLVGALPASLSALTRL